MKFLGMDLIKDVGVQYPETRKNRRPHPNGSMDLINPNQKPSCAFTEMDNWFWYLYVNAKDLEYSKQPLKRKTKLED